MTRERSKSPFAVDWPQRTTPYNSNTPTRQLRQPSPEERIRRNVACVNCRNSKVKCRLSTTPGQPCQRCARLEISCVVDKSHKRITKRSKLEQLEQELKSIKHAIHDPAVPIPVPAPASAITTSTNRWAPPSPRSAGQSSHPDLNTPKVLDSTTFTEKERERAEAQLVEEHAAASRRDGDAQEERRSREDDIPTKDRTLRGHLIPSSDIDYYFTRFQTLYHPHLPILPPSSLSPNLIFTKSPTLFHTILYISTRRSPPDPILHDLLVQELTETPWLMFSSQNLTLETIHALLLLAVWPLPGVRLLADPTPTLLGMAGMACGQLGFHTGKGACLEFLCGVRPEVEVSDEEASSTWIACQLLTNKMSAQAGLPPPSIQYSDRRCKLALQDPRWKDLLSAYDLQKWMNKFHTAMAAEIAAHDSLSQDTISRWESEFDLLEPTFFAGSNSSEITNLTLLSSRLEIRSYYVLSPPSVPTPAAAAFNTTHYTRLYHTSLTLLQTFTSLSPTLTPHLPLSSYRPIVVASAILVSSLQQHTTCCSHLDLSSSTSLAKQAWTAVRTCSLREGDMPQRVSMFMELFWKLETRGELSKEDVPVRVWGERLSVGVAYGCLRRMKRALIDKREIKGDEYRDKEKMEEEKRTRKENEEQEEVQQELEDDPFLGADWLMDGMEWTGNGDPFFMGLL